jgi:N-acylneuraminate cytidylyltransferase
MAHIVAIILARGGSKGIPGKNIINFCGKPLLVWTIEQLKQVKEIDSIWVSSDSEQILSVARDYGTYTICRPDEISGDKATSESGWLHALDYIEEEAGTVNVVVAPQVTSPLREPNDVKNGLSVFYEGQYDSLFSACEVEDFFLWKMSSGGELISLNYDYKNRKRRQDITRQYLENGLFYIFKPDILRKYNNRLGGKIGAVKMDIWKMFEIDTMEDLRICEALMKAFLL